MKKLLIITILILPLLGAGCTTNNQITKGVLDQEFEQLNAGITTNTPTTKEIPRQTKPVAVKARIAPPSIPERTIYCNGKSWSGCAKNEQFLCLGDGSNGGCFTAAQQNVLVQVLASEKNDCYNQVTSLTDDPNIISACVNFGYSLEDYHNGYCQLPFPDVNQVMLIQHKKRQDLLMACNLAYSFNKI